MKKFIVFLIIAVLCILGSKNVYASTWFYEGEYIDGIYMNKQKKDSSTIYYQKARFFRQVMTDQYAYCIDPFVFFNTASSYDEVITPDNLTENQKEEISLIAYFGYGYKNHTDKKWYAITQMMIWKVADPTGNFYFTDGLNGPKIEIFTNEIAEINNLISDYKKETSLNNQTYTIVEGQKLTIEDTNHILSNYKVNNQNFSIEGNTLVGNNLTEGTYELSLTREENYHNKPLLFYQSQNSQALMQTGDIKNKVEKLNIQVLKTEIEITKIDKDTKNTTPSGEGKLEGAVYGLFNETNTQIATLTIGENKKTKITNLPLGKYYIKELIAPKGYQLDKEIHNIEITKENPTLKITLEDEIIKKKIKIYKTYDEDNKNPEKNISFSIYNKNNIKVATITTDENGEAEITLPYGEYKIVQENTTEGYHKIEDFTIKVKDMKEEKITLTDYKIKVPNTKTNIILYILTIISNILWH